MSLYDRLKAWNKRRKARAFLRKHGICLVHFVQMDSRLETSMGELIGWMYVCPKCEEEAVAKANEKYLSELKESLRETLKDRIDVGADS